MNDLERDLRTLLETKADLAHVTPRPEPQVLKRARRRQLGTVLGASIAVVGVLALAIVTIDSLRRSEPVTPAFPSTITRSLNGIEITFPDTWHLIDPDAAGLNGPEPTPDLPRLVLALSPHGPGELLACPGMVAGTPPTFLMTIREEPLALSGEGSGPWPADLEPMDADSSDSACYPGWEFLRAGWTTAGRTFETRVGFAPDAVAADRDALLAAFARLSFERSTEPAASVVLATGTAGGEDWELIATRQTDGLSLALQAETFGAGTGGFDPSSDGLQLTGHAFGGGARAELVVFGAVPASVVRLEVLDDLSPSEAEILDVPDGIDARLNAFVIVVDADARVVINAYDAADRLVASGAPGTASGEPVELPPSLPAEVSPEHGGTYWGVYVAVSDSLDDPDMQRAFGVAEELGYSPSIGDIACDDDAATELGVDPNATRVAVYFATRRDAELAAENANKQFGLSSVGVARVTTYCLD